MSSISNITTSCRGFVELMNRTTNGWHDDLQRTYYNHVLNPMISIAAEYQSLVCDYLRLLDNYEHRMASLAGTTPIGTGIGENELFRHQIDPNILAQMINRQR